jgi:hypothetical protein
MYGSEAEYTQSIRHYIIYKYTRKITLYVEFFISFRVNTTVFYLI